MFDRIKKYCEDRIQEFDLISAERKLLLEKVSDYIKQHKNPEVVFVCTHNSRRSQFGQVWATVAARYYGLVSTHFYSAGTEDTAFHPNSVNALKRAGLRIKMTKNGRNPVYLIDFGEDSSFECFSKTIDHTSIPKSNFAAVMTCDHAEENCPYLPGAELRIPITYDDPKVSDGTPEMQKVYDERCKQIAREVLYTLSF